MCRSFLTPSCVLPLEEGGEVSSPYQVDDSTRRGEDGRWGRRTVSKNENDALPVVAILQIADLDLFWDRINERGEGRDRRDDPGASSNH